MKSDFVGFHHGNRYVDFVQLLWLFNSPRETRNIIRLDLHEAGLLYKYASKVGKGNILEIGIETNNAFRGKGYAFIICIKIIEYCLANKLLPVWACKFENTGSYLLAQKLGFAVSKILPYYRLCRNN